jgi:hypothetical protein
MVSIKPGARHAFADVEPARMTHANTLNSTLQELGAGLGVAVGAFLVGISWTLAEPAGLGAGPDTAFRVAFVLLAVIIAHIAEIVSRFDVIAIQELRRSATVFLAMLDRLGPDWAFLTSDVTEGDLGCWPPLTVTTTAPFTVTT